MGNVAKSKMVSAGSRRQRTSTGLEMAWLNAGALALLMVSVFANIYSTHACRELYAHLQVLESSQWFLHEDYGRLLLEQSAWASHYRVEKVARTDLGMQAPDLAQYKVLTP